MQEPVGNTEQNACMQQSAQEQKPFELLCHIEIIKREMPRARQGGVQVQSISFWIMLSRTFIESTTSKRKLTDIHLPVSISCPRIYLYSQKS